jgi:hypothetical protein
LIFKSTRAKLADAKNRIRKCAVLKPVTRELERWASSLERAGNCLLLEAGRAAGRRTRIIGTWKMTRSLIELIYTRRIAITAESEYR